MKVSDLYDSALLWLERNPQRSLELLELSRKTYGIEKDVTDAKVSNAIGVALTKLRPFQAKRCMKEFYNAKTHGDQSDLEHFTNIAFTYMMMGDPQGAEIWSRDALEINPDFEDGYVKLFNALMHQGEYFKAYGVQLECLRRFNTPMNRRNLALTELTLSNMEYQGMYKLALRNYRSRHPELGVEYSDMCDFSSSVIPHANAFTIFLEQGIGDCIMMMPYIRYLASRCETLHVVSVAQDSAIDAMKAFKWPTNVLFYKSGIPFAVTKSKAFMFDLLDLGMPDQICPQDSSPQKNEGTKTGICWRGNPAHPNDFYRSIEFKDLVPFLKKHGNKLVNLQSNVTPEEMAVLKECGVEIADDIMDPAKLKSRMLRLKQVLTVDTFMSHFAGASGVKCYTMVPLFIDWRWGMTNAKTPWYPNHTLIRQKRSTDWASVLMGEASEII